MLRDRTRGSLQRRVESVGAITALLLLVGITGLLALSGLARSRLTEGTGAFLQEQRIADRITRGVTRQLALASGFPVTSGFATRQGFLDAGEEVHGQIRQYLFRDLSSAERLQLEEMREAHQHFEVVAVQAAELFARGAEADAGAALQEMRGLASEFLDALDRFLATREADLVGLQQGQDRVFRLLLAGGGALALGVLLGSTFLAWELHRRVTHPLGELSRATERVAEGEMDARVRTVDEDEFRAVAESFNRMAESLQRREDELRQAMAEVRSTQADLIQAEKLGAIGRMSAGFAHELNNPLTSVLGYTQLLEDRIDTEPAPTPSEIRELLEPLAVEASRARGLVRNFLQVSRRPDTNLGAVPLRSAMEVVASLRQYAFRQAGLDLEVGEVPDVHVWAEPQMLQGIFLNLVNNAFDALRPAGAGTLTIRGEVVPTDGGSQELELVFEDDGPGLSHPDRVFEPFFTTKPVGEGTGLGLALVHQFVTAFGGRVRAENRPNGGARFVLRLAVVDPSADMAQPAVDVPALASSAAPGDRPEGNGAGPTILVVEDEAHLRTLQARILRRRGAEVLLAADVREARALLDAHEVDAIVSDVKMPGETGVDLYRWLGETRPRLTRRFLFVTGDATAAGLEEVVAESPDLLLKKPFRIDEYLARVEGILS